jgi:isopentenyl-diphosphate delta-isomerase
MPTIAERKDAHLALAAKARMQYAEPAGFDDVLLVHCAIPECSLKSVDTSTTFLKRRLSAPLLITGMTGGTDKGAAINQRLAKAAEKAKVALGLGSQRPMLKDASTLAHYNVRKLCPSVPLIGNIGAVNLQEYPLSKIEWLVSSIEADALAIHLNPLQEAIQPEGDTNFAGVLKAIGKVCDKLSVPVIVKETGAGITTPAAQALLDAGVSSIECSGRGGTSWSKVEYARGGRIPGFEEWGWPSVPALVECVSVGPTLCTGGLRSGLDAAKGIAIGAKLAGAAHPFFVASDPAKLAEQWREQIRTAMFLTGSKNLEQFAQVPLLITGRSAELIHARGFDASMFSTRRPPGLPVVSPSANETGHYI